MTDPNVRKQNLSGGQGFGGTKEAPKANPTTQAQQPPQNFSVPDVDVAATLATIDAHLDEQLEATAIIQGFNRLVDEFRRSGNLTGNPDLDARIIRAATIEHKAEGIGLTAIRRRRPAPLIQVIEGTARPLALPPSDSVA